MTRNYKDYTIRVQSVCNDYGFGCRAEFFIPKNNGKKANIRIYEIYKLGIKPGEVIKKVEQIIDLGL